MKSLLDVCWDSKYEFLKAIRREKEVFLNWLNIKGNFKNIWLKAYNSVHFLNKDSQIFLIPLKSGGLFLLQLKMGNLPVESCERNAIPVSAGLGFTTTSRFYALYFGRFLFRALSVYESTIFTEEITGKILKEGSI